MSSPRVVTLCPGLVDKIEECWLPHHFREVIKRAKNAFKPLEYLELITARIDFVIDYKANLEAREALQEIREEIQEILDNGTLKRRDGTHFQRHEKHLRILTGKNSINSETIHEERPEIPPSEILRDNQEFIEENLTLQVWVEANQDINEAAKRLDISRGLVVQRLKKMGVDLKGELNNAKVHFSQNGKIICKSHSLYGVVTSSSIDDVNCSYCHYWLRKGRS